MKFIDFFAGVGGFRRGMEMAGHECVGFCEFDKYATMSYTAMHLASQQQIDYLKTLSMKERQKEILKEKYKNGEWYEKDIREVTGGGIPYAECWCAGFPCQDLSIAGKRAGLTEGNRSSLFFEIMRLLKETEKENKPRYIFLENVKNLLSINQGWDFAKVLNQLDENGYDAEWAVINSKDFGVPQNRERVFIVGHLRGTSGSKIFPINGTDKKNCVDLIAHRNGFRRSLQVYDCEGITETLDTSQGGGRGIYAGIKVIGQSVYDTGKTGQRTGIHSINGNVGAMIATQYKEPPRVAIPVIDPDGRRFKENGDPSFTLTAQDRRGVAVGVDVNSTKNGIVVEMNNGVKAYAIWYPKENCYVVIRRLTPKECFRLQGWTDDYFEKAQLVNSDSQLYKLAGNGVTVTVIKAIAERL
jgi:DNA (cytosine-5)-methyltransferase 1